MSSDFAHAICKISVAHLISQSGFDKSSSQACDLLTEILDRYLIHLVARCKGFAEMGQGDPNEINAVDVSKAFESMRLDFTKLEEFLGTWKLAKAKTATKGAIHLDRAEEPDVPSASALAREPPAFPRLEPASFPINLELALCKERRLPPSLAAYLLQDESDGRCPSSHHPGADDSAITTASIPPHFPPFPDIGSLEPCPTSPSKTLRSSSTQESTPPAEPSASSDPHTHYPAADQDPNRKQALSLANPYSHTIPFSGSQLCSFGRLYERTTPTPLNSFSTQPSTATVYLSQLLETAILASSRPQPSRAVLPNATACRLLDHRATSGTGIGDECTIFGADGGTAEKGVLHELLKSSALPYIPQLLLEHPPAPLSKSSKAKKTKEAAKPSAVPIIAAAPLVIPPLSPPPIQAVKRKDSDFSASSPPPPAKEKKKKRKDSIGVAKGDPASTGALGHSSKPGDSAESVLLGKKPGFSDALEMQPSARAMEPIYTNDDLDGLASGSMAPKIKLRLNVAKSSSTTASREGDADMLFSDPFQPATNGEADSQEAAVPNRPAATISLLGRPVRADPTTMHPMYMKENDVPRNVGSPRDTTEGSSAVHYANGQHAQGRLPEPSSNHNLNHHPLLLQGHDLPDSRHSPEMSTQQAHPPSSADTLGPLELQPSLIPISEVGSQHPDAREDVIRCICTSPTLDDGLFMIACDACGIWFHGRCVGIEATTGVEEWHCVRCHGAMMT